MKSADKGILVVNGGSSSIKFALFTVNRPLRLSLAGRIEGIGTPATVFSVKHADTGEHLTQSTAGKDHATAVAMLMDWIEGGGQHGGLIGVGHRIVHGGPNYHRPQRLTPKIVEELRQLVPLAPEHLPQEILLMEALHQRFPQLPQIVCFDTAFHHQLPRVAKLMAIPRHFQAQGLRRYGFHGLSYEFLMEELFRTEGAVAAGGRIILAHLGNGASLAAVRNGKSIDTSMGFTPAAGVPMGTRSGDLDPGLAGYLAQTQGLDARQFNEMVNFKSGLLGVSETSADMRNLLLREAEDSRAAEAIALFCYQVKKWIGSFAAALGGLDMLVFSGGIGENAAVVRSRICSGLEFLGIELDEPRNGSNAARISADSARAKVLVLPANEELMIARSVCRLLDIELDEPGSKT